MIGRFFFIALLLVGATAAALYATRTGYRVWQTQEGDEAVCHYWLGIGMAEARHPAPADGPPFECPLLLRDVKL